MPDMPTMTNLEKLIAAHVQTTVVATLSAATQRVAEEMAREALKDPAWRKEMQALTRKYFGETLEALRQPGTNGAAVRPRRRRKALNK